MRTITELGKKCYYMRDSWRDSVICWEVYCAGGLARSLFSFLTGITERTSYPLSIATTEVVTKLASPHQPGSLWNQELNKPLLHLVNVHIFEFSLPFCHLANYISKKSSKVQKVQIYVKRKWNEIFKTSNIFKLKPPKSIR